MDLLRIIRLGFVVCCREDRSDAPDVEQPLEESRDDKYLRAAQSIRRENAIKSLSGKPPLVGRSQPNETIEPLRRVCLGLRIKPSRAANSCRELALSITLRYALSIKTMQIPVGGGPSHEHQVASDRCLGAFVRHLRLLPAHSGAGGPSSPGHQVRVLQHVARLGASSFPLKQSARALHV
jgi:hypothetical protein